MRQVFSHHTVKSFLYCLGKFLRRDIGLQQLDGCRSGKLRSETGSDVGDAAVTVTTASNGEVFSTETYIRLGRNFYAEVQAMSGTERITVVGDQAYYFTSAPAGPRAAEGRYVMSVTAEERGKLMERFFEGSTPSPFHDVQLTEALLNSAVSGVRHADGTVELTCAGLDDGFTERLFGAPVEEGAKYRQSMHPG